MRGVPKNSLKTKSDYETCQSMALDGSLRSVDVARLRRYWQALIDGRYVMVKDRVLDTDEQADGEEPEYRILTDEETQDRVQYKREEDAEAKIFRLGYSVEDVEGKLDELEAL